jgi:hypothetical protein
MMAGKFFKAALMTVAVCALAVSACSGGAQYAGGPASIRLLIHRVTSLSGQATALAPSFTGAGNSPWDIFK